MENKHRFYIAGAVVVALALTAGLIGFNQMQERDFGQNSMSESSDQPSTNGTNNNAGNSSETVITRDQLKENDGKDGNKCWIAVDGIVYDPSSSREWQNGEHVPSGGRAKCGEDLTDVISESPHGKSVLGEIQKVGTLSE